MLTTSLMYAPLSSLTLMKVHILLPPLAKLRMVVDRLRPLSTDGVTFRANHSGELQLAATTDNARVEVGWGGLNNPGWSASLLMPRHTRHSLCPALHL